jgi:predicted ATPase
VRHSGEGAYLPLGAAPDRAFLDALVDAAPNRLDERFREELFALTEGQPLFTIEVLRSLRASGSVAPDAEGRWIATRPIDWRALPVRVEALVRDQVEVLDELSRGVLEAAAVEGEEFCAETVAAAIGRPLTSVVGDLSEVLRRQRHLVAPYRARYVAGRRLDLYRFRHALLQRYLYGRLDEAERALLHDRAAAAVRAVYGDSPEGERLLASHLAKGMRPGGAPRRLSSVA